AFVATTTLKPDDLRLCKILITNTGTASSPNARLEIRASPTTNAPENISNIDLQISWGFFRRRSAIFREGDQQFCDSDQESERSDAGFGIVSEVIEMVKEKRKEFR